MKQSEVAEALARLGTAYVNAKLPTDTEGAMQMTEVWHSVLGDLDTQHVMAAVQQHIKTEKWFPAPAEIRQAAIRLQVGLPSPAMAWNDVQRAAKSADRAQYENMHKVALQAMRDIGGPSSINWSLDIGRTREAFLKAYEARVQEVYISPGIAALPAAAPENTPFVPGITVADVAEQHVENARRLVTGITADEAMENVRNVRHVLSGGDE